MINKEKNLTNDIRGKTSEPGSYWWYHYLDLHRTSKMIVSEANRMIRLASMFVLGVQKGSDDVR